MATPAVWRARLWAVIVAIGLSSLAGTALAAVTPPGENITASPTQITLTLQPGASARGSVTIINDGPKTYDFKTYATPYRVSGEDYDPSFVVDPSDTTDASHWVTLPTNLVHITPRQTITVPYTITIPPGTGGGGYYAALFFQTNPEKLAGTGVNSQQRIGVVAYLTVAGTVIQRGNVVSFTANLLQPGPPLTATLRLANQGNVHYPADITEHITDVFGQPKADIHVKREVLPQTIRRFQLEWAQAPRFGLFRVNGVVNMLGRTEVLPTHYVLILSAGAFIAVAIAICLIVVLAVWWWLGRRRQHQIK